MSTKSDRNLLLGILALQMDFISREQLIAATNAWVVDKDLSLDEILLEQEALRADTHPLLVALVDKHLEMHGGDAQKSLAAVSSIGSMREALNSLGDGEVAASMSLVANGRDSVDPYATEAFSGVATHSDGRRFRVLRPHAKGGLGEVFVARDNELNREVALKEIQPRHADHSDSRSRFVLEAEVTGGLEHPGIVPVYGLGQYGDGRPYYAMRFIRGDSLLEAIDRFFPSRKRDAPAQAHHRYDSVEFRKLLGRFVDVCNAIQYAHSRGVLHRDLKPGNIMLGKYGETLVVDWGLAKLQGRDEATKVDGETTLQPQSGSGTAPTQFGSAIGTPAYMPPEQAAGKLDELGPASDVYSLGATLYHLLTGQPPVRGANVGEMLRKVQRGDFPAPCHVIPEIPKSLEAICLRAMAIRPQGRYASPQKLADDVECYLADEPITAYAEPLADRARRWVRKHQTLAVTTAAVVLVSAVGLGFFSTIVGGKNAQLATLNTSLYDTNAKLDAKNVELTQANRRESNARLLAESNEESARQQSELALATLTSVTKEIQSGLKDLSGAGEIRRRLLETSLSKLENVATQYVEQSKVDRQTMTALTEMGGVVLQFGVEDNEIAQPDNVPARLSNEQESAVELAGTFYRRAHQIAVQLAADLPGDARAQRDLFSSYNNLGDVQLRSGGLGEATASYQKGLEIAEKLAADDPSDAGAQRDLSVSYDYLGNVQLQSGELSEAAESYQKGLEIAEKLAADDPSDARARRGLSISHNRLGHVRMQTAQLSEAAASYQEGLEIAEKLAADDPSDMRAQRNLFWSYNYLGKVQLRSGQSSEALMTLQKCLELALQLAADDPSDARAQRHLSIAYNQLGDAQLRSPRSSEALASYQKCLEIAEKLAANDPGDAWAQRDLFASFSRIGIVQLRSGHSSEALVSFQKGLEIAEMLAANDVSDAQAQSDLHVSYNNLGDAQLQSRRLSEALVSFQNGLEIAKKLATKDASNAQAQRDLHVSHNYLGAVQLQSGRSSEALESFQKGVAIAQKLATDDPNDAQAQRDLAILFVELGDTQLQMGELSAALGPYQKGLAIRERMAADDPGDREAQRDLALSYDALGNVQFQSGQTSEALASYQKSRAIREKLAVDDPSNAQAQRDLSVSYVKVGDAQRQLRRLDEALVSYRKNFELDEKFAAEHPSEAQAQRDLSISYSRIGNVQLESGQSSEALASYQKCLEIAEKLAANDPGDARAQRHVAVSYEKVGSAQRDLGQLTNALASYRKSLEIAKKQAEDDPTNAMARRSVVVGYNRVGLLEKIWFDYDAAASAFRAGAEVLRQMIEKGMLVEQSKRELEIFEREARLAEQAQVAFGDWEELLKQPMEAWASLLGQRALEFAKRGRVDEAAQAAEKLRGLESEDRFDLYNTACAFALCATWITARGGEELTADQAQRSEQYVASALAMLRQAIAAGWDDFAHIQQDPGFTILRDRPEFQAILKSDQ